MILYRQDSATIQTDPDEISRKYNACVKEVKEGNATLGNLALHHEAMKLMAQKKSEEKSEGRCSVQLQRRNTDDGEKRRSFRALKNMDSFSHFFFGDDEATTASSQHEPMPSNEGMRRKSNRCTMNRGSLNLNKLSNAIRESIPLNILSASPNSSIKGEPTEVIRRRQSVYVSGFFEDIIAINNVVKELELSDSESECFLSDTEEEPFVSRNEEAKRSDSCVRRGSPALNIPMKAGAGSRGRRVSFEETSPIEGTNSSERVDDSSFQQMVSGLSEGSAGSGPARNVVITKSSNAVVDCVPDMPPREKRAGFNQRVIHRRESRRPSGRRSSLASVDEVEIVDNVDTSSTQGLDMSVTKESFNDSFSVHEGSLICGWGRQSLTGSISDEEDAFNAGDTLICDWKRRSSLLSSSSLVL